MSTWVKVLIGTICGLGAGFTAGFLFHKRLNDVQFEEIEPMEMEKIEAALVQQEQSSKPAELKVKTDDDLPTDPNKLRMTLQGKVSYLHADQEAKEQYAQIWNTVKDYSDEENANELPIEEEEDPGEIEEGFDEEFLEMIEEEQVEPGQVAPPYPISMIEFYNERQEYDKITIEWYEPDTFVDEREQIIGDLKAYFGNIDIPKLFSKTGPDEDPEIRFIRNESYGTDYEIVRHHRSWSETTGGSD